MMKRLALMSLVLLLTVGVSAQDAPPRLRVPSAEEYLAVATDIGSTMWSPLLVYEMERRYVDTLASLPYDILSASFDRLPIAAYDFNRQNLWEEARVLAWMREHVTDLSTTESLTFDDYMLTVTSADFDGDGTGEYLLDVERSPLQLPHYQMLLVVRQDAPGGYRPFLLPELWSASQYGYFGGRGGILSLHSVRDVTGDGQPEILAVRQIEGRDQTFMRLYVLGWQDGTLADLANGETEYQTWIHTDPIPLFDSWTFSTTASGEPVIEQREPFFDNWGCTGERIEQFTWNGRLYLRSSFADEYTDGFACDMRLAEMEMAVPNTERAIPFFEVAVRRGETSALAQYAHIRLALAYAVQNRMTDAGAQLDTLAALRPPDSRLTGLEDALLQAYRASPTPGSLCLTAYNYLVEHPHYFQGLTDYGVGDVYNNPVWFLAEIVQPPADSACNVDALLFVEFARYEFPIGTPPDRQLAAYGWRTRASFHADLNGDSVDDWMVWLDSEMAHPVMFMSSGGTYYPYSFDDGRDKPSPLSDRYIVDAVELPDGTLALGILDYVRTHPYETSDLGGGPECLNNPAPPENFPGRLILWRATGIYFDRALTTFICKTGDFADFVQGNVVHGWQPNDMYLTPTIYSWDAEAHIFAADINERPTPISEAASTPLDLNRALQTYASGSYAELLAMTESLIQAGYDAAQDDVILSAYVRALALEGLGRDDEAAAQFAVIATDDSFPDWAALAALHLEGP